MRISIIKLIVVFLFHSVLFSQEKMMANDSIFIKVDEKIIGNQLLINKFNKYGESVTQKEITNEILVLLITDSLKNRLLQQNKYTDSLNIVRGYSKPDRGNKIPYGMDFKHYNLDFENSKKSLNQFQKSFDFFAVPTQGLVSDEQLENWKEEILKWNDVPLGSYFITDNYLKNKNIINYTGTEESYNYLENELVGVKNIFLVLPINYNMVGDYDYRLWQIKKIYYDPRL